MTGENYGGLKVGCEAVVREVFDGASRQRAGGADRRAARPDRAVHVLARPHRPRRRGPRARRSRAGRPVRRRPRPRCLARPRRRAADRRRLQRHRRAAPHDGRLLETLPRRLGLRRRARLDDRRVPARAGRRHVDRAAALARAGEAGFLQVDVSRALRRRPPVPAARGDGRRHARLGARGRGARARSRAGWRSARRACGPEREAELLAAWRA